MLKSDGFEQFNLYVLPEKFFIEPRNSDGGRASLKYIEIDRISTNIRVRGAFLVELMPPDQNEESIPVTGAEIRVIYGILGILQLVSSPVLVVVTRVHRAGVILGHDVRQIDAFEIFPYRRTTAHLTDRQVCFSSWLGSRLQARYERHFQDLLAQMLSLRGFYYSHSFDITHSLQWLSVNSTPEFQSKSLIEQADDRFVWNGYLLEQLRAIEAAAAFCVPVILGFFGQRRIRLGSAVCWLTIISRRSIYAAGVRFYKRGVNADGHPANFVETEQIVMPDGDQEAVSSFVQLRGSIPLYWSQRPNLRWQPAPLLKSTDDQQQAYVRHFQNQRIIYGGSHVIVNLVNQKGREKKVGGELERIAMQANLPFVRYYAFDFHKECGAMQWDRLSILKQQLNKEITEFGFFVSSLRQPSLSRQQRGYFRTNCMDCLDRTNVVQSMFARTVLPHQLTAIGLLSMPIEVQAIPELEEAFKNLWADNGDECSRQYAGTGALKADYTRLGKRTFLGALNDGANAITRYVRNNFADGHRQDAIDLFLGNFRVDSTNLPDSLEVSPLSLNLQGVALIAAAIAMSMTVLCVLVAENVTATLFWMCVFGCCLAFIILNGEDFVNAPKLKKD